MNIFDYGAACVRHSSILYFTGFREILYGCYAFCDHADVPSRDDVESVTRA
jgi:hypothetical protein